MDIINPFETNITNLAEALTGKWGKVIGEEYKLFYIQGIVIGVGRLEVLKEKSTGNVSEWIELTNNVYLGIMR